MRKPEVALRMFLPVKQPRARGRGKVSITRKSLAELFPLESKKGSMLTF